MSSFQLWVQWKEQNAENVQGSSDWTLYKNTDNLEEIFISKVELETNGNKAMVTKSVEIKVEVTY